MDISQRDFMFPASAPTYSESHGGDNVAACVSGPYSRLFRGTFEQSYKLHTSRARVCCLHWGWVKSK